MFSFLAVLLTGSALLSCTEKDTTGPDPDPTVASVAVTPSSVGLPIGEQLQLEATPTDANGTAISGLSVSWGTDNAAVASVNGSGLVTGNATGSTTITATVEGMDGTADVSVYDPAAGTITLNPSITHQTMVGWEATADIGVLDFMPSDYVRWKDAVADSALAIGVNRLRLEVRSGMENNTDYFTQWVNGQIPRSTYTANWYRPINDNGDPFLINTGGFQWSELDAEIDAVVTPLRQRLSARGEDLYVNLNFVDGSRSWSFEHRETPEEYAEFMLAAFQHIESKYGWVPDAIEIILEPGGGDWTYQHIGQALVAAGARLANNGYTPDFIAPSGTSMAGAIGQFDGIIQMSGVQQYLTEFSYHRYGTQTDDLLRQIESRASQYGVRASMLELIGADYTHLHKDLTMGKNAAWQQYVLGFPTNDNGAQYLVVDYASAAVRVGDRAKYFRQYFEYVRRGAQRIESASKNAQLSPIGFINTNGKYVVVVKASGGHTFDIGGLPAGTYGITYTTPSQYHATHGDVTLSAGELLQTSIPNSGVITIYGK